MRSIGSASSISFAFALFFAAIAPSPARAQDAIDRLDMKAHAAFDSQDYDTAVKLWTAELKLDPNNANAFYNRASAYELKRDPDKAIADFTDAIRLDPKDPQAHLSRARIYAEKWYAATSKGGADSEDADKMIADFGELIRLKPDAQSYIARAGAYRQLRKDDKAIADYNEMIRLDPKSVLGYQYRGATYDGEGEWDKAIADFDQVLRLDSNAASIHLLRGEAYLSKGDCDKAIADANAELQQNPDNPGALSLRGNAYSSHGDYDKALADYHAIMTDNPDFAEAYNAEAWLYATSPDAKYRDGAKAMELAKKACDLTGWKEPSFLDTMAAAEAEAGKFDDAVKHQKQALELSKTTMATDFQIKDISSRIPLYEKKQPYREPKK